MEMAADSTGYHCLYGFQETLKPALQTLSSNDNGLGGEFYTARSQWAFCLSRRPSNPHTLNVKIFPGK